VVAGLKERLPFVFSVSMTTRDPRPGEVDGVDYHYVTRSDFEEAIDAGRLAEWAEYGGNLYGTPAAALEQELTAGNDVLLDIEIQGSEEVKDRFPDATLVWIEAPDREVLERRLRGRGDTPEGDIARRLAVAEAHSARARRIFDHFVVNDELDVAIDRVTDILAHVPDSAEDS